MVADRTPRAAPATQPPFGVATRNVDAFEKLEQIGEGTYGQVYKARSRDDGAIVALKKIRMTKDQEKDGFPITALREIKILNALRHENIVLLREIVTSAASEANKGKGSIYMVFEFMDHDLTGLMDYQHSAPFSVAQIKCYLRQLLNGLHFCHMNKVLHRDIKGANLLINNRGQLKLADFGLARTFDDQARAYTNRCVTLWYRPPELLLGATLYGPEVDLWSVGCVFGEMLQRKPALPGKDEADQLDLICRLCGMPDERSWPGVSRLPFYDKLVDRRGTYHEQPHHAHARPLVAKLSRTVPDAAALDLLNSLLTLDPQARASCATALDHDYFRIEPLPAQPSELPTYKSSHEFNRKKRQAQHAAAAGQGAHAGRDGGGGGGRDGGGGGGGGGAPGAQSAVAGAGEAAGAKRARSDASHGLGRSAGSAGSARAAVGAGASVGGKAQPPPFSSIVPPPRQRHG
ncbi:hypothetical protein KFE25_013197 [Diacronema lutheri]|uniref:Protein kinase domain-containing protein n=1 Tax=Diacronema lutheri TaxID=2081491 RepID=A0A8J5XGL0_DIALT|nr:hypothetical protein KFE25_013197 [Diacronema lutheri]